MEGRENIGGGKGIRTLDPSVANAVLSQLSYAPTKRQYPAPREIKIKSQWIDYRISEY